MLCETLHETSAPFETPYQPPDSIPQEKHDLWRRLFGHTDPKLLKRWKRYNANNPWVFPKFLELARELKREGFEECSGWLIVNQIRWQVYRSTKGDTFKISNDYVAILTRIAIYKYPDEFEGFFSIKRMKEERGCEDTL
jgi:hypothetical protein